MKLRNFATSSALVVGALLAVSQPALQAQDFGNQDRGYNNVRQDERNLNRDGTALRQDIGERNAEARSLAYQQNHIAQDRREIRNDVDSGRLGAAACEVRDVNQDRRVVAETRRSVERENAEISARRNQLNHDRFDFGRELNRY